MLSLAGLAQTVAPENTVLSFVAKIQETLEIL